MITRLRARPLLSFAQRCCVVLPSRSVHAIHGRPCLRLGPGPRLPATRPSLLHSVYARTRSYSDDLSSRLETDGIPLRHSGPTTAALVSYAEGNWPKPDTVPEGWSTSWKDWEYLLTFFAYSPYYLRLPQIEMLVNIKHAIPGNVRPVMYSKARDAMIFLVDIYTGEEGTGGTTVFLLNCRTNKLFTYQPADRTKVPQNVMGLLELIAGLSDLEAAPMIQLEADKDGSAVLQRPTTPEEEMMNPDEERKGMLMRLEEAIANVRAFIVQAEAELSVDEIELAKLKEQGMVLPAKEGYQLDENAHAQFRQSLVEAKEKLAELENLRAERFS
ncbi:unnamed protein product [Mycena citricolor]|uniref:Uncharacterized protein n=1 Tax=Mycena citricolor TaxID=2018698 RepID=A0AAD2HSC2_9AGAR|nr:unnamed protein product [Mycena citricolor]